jgi:hypothetical protein
MFTESNHKRRKPQWVRRSAVKEKDKTYASHSKNALRGSWRTTEHSSIKDKEYYNMEMNDTGDNEKTGDTNGKDDMFMKNCVRKAMRDGKNPAEAKNTCQAMMDKMKKDMGSKAGIELTVYPIVMDLRKRNMTYLVQDVEEYLHSPEQE